MVCCKSFFKEQTLTGPDISNITIQLYNLETKRQQGKEEKVGLTLHSVNFFFLSTISIRAGKMQKQKQKPKTKHDYLWFVP